MSGQTPPAKHPNQNTHASKKQGGKLSARTAAALVIKEVIVNKQSLASLLPKYSLQVTQAESGLFQALCFGCCRHFYELQHAAHQFLQKPLKPKDQDIMALIMLGILQLSHMRTPAHAAVSATVAGAKQLKKPWANKLINGVLRSYQRQQNNISSTHGTEVIFNHPSWLLAILKTQYPNQWQAIVTANNQHPPMTLRVNQRHIKRDEYLQTLQTNGIEAFATPHSSVGIQLNQPVDVALLPDFADGFVSVQDEAPQLTPALLDLVPGQHVLDACAAPGGKTCHMLEHEPELASMIALDFDSERLQRIKENLSRLKLNAHCIAGDAGKPEDWWNGELFDRILLDAPCSATGVIRRHPDIKLLRHANDIDNLAKLQQQILATLWALLKPGGKLLYATCSVMQQENSQQVAHFLQQTSNASLLNLEVGWGFDTGYGRQLLPTDNSHDGFFYALLQKTNA
ncbi:16S rRNA (cytosine(967)-C(5))-methyltransferase RsmB [Zooshikella harenae]|uniref:16S rRNA (cytosine(967)-C(5))-methyltransferase n=1 Tax=Zooshikella harenae TaxID=2827238 RepID=A0ABS5ZCK9_9GAMM|nr:16S rRNA (cytosine(967)-C(5))-methyltransferase RsmB [Zooshikella harenae]MBU2711700.1 16S rRNA (cytosine(967)-C(5))-methyltransferase RsmB [Zooshikella harenae]